MMNRLRLPLAGLLLSSAFCCAISAQTVNATQQLTLEGLRTANNHGNFTAARYAADGSLYLLLDEHDGIRLLKTNAAAANVLAQSQQGAAGDVGLSMALDPAGNVYVAGTSTSGTLAGTSGAAFPSRADSSTNSFLAKYDANLNLIFVTFLGAGRTAAAGVAATADSAFVAGITYSTAFPVTPAGIQQTPASGSNGNGFVERFSADGSTLTYATYLTGVNGDTTPTGIAANGSDDAFITGSTTSSGYPTAAALVPNILGATSGFLTGLTPAGDGFLFSTFLPGSGMTSIALDSATPSLLLSGNVSLGQFPVATVAMPLTSANYQTLLRLTPDGQSMRGSALLTPGTQSFVTAASDGSAWISGALSTPLFPGTLPPEYDAGDSFLLHLNAASVFDQTLRFGGLPGNSSSYSSLTSTVAAPAISSAGALALPGTISAGTNSSLLATERFDLPMIATPNSVLPDTLADVLPTSASCTTGDCYGSAGLLALVSTAASAPSLALSTGDLPNLTLRNLGSASATGIALAATGFTLVSDCGTALAPSEGCNIALTGSGPGSIRVSAANAASYTVPLPANTLPPDAVVLSTDELDFGIVSSASGTITRTLTVTNINTVSESFTSAPGPGGLTAYTFVQAATDCPANGASGYLLAAGDSCHITLGLSASTNSANDGPANGFWTIGSHDVRLTGFAQAAALSVSATEVDFGTQISSGLKLPRYLYLSDNSTSPIAHAAVSLPAGSPFTVTDNCPDTLEPQSVCQIVLTYSSPTAPSSDAATLTLDDGISVLVTGETAAPAGVTGSATNPNLAVSPTTLTFGTPVAVSGISSDAQTVTVTNTGGSAFPLAIAVSGDFSVVNGCPASLGAGASCEIEVSFTPTQPGERDGLLSITAGSSFAPTYVTLTGTGSAILPPNNGTLDLGEAVVGEPVAAWYKVQQAFPTLTVTSGNPAFGVILVEDTGEGYGDPPPSSFAQTATGTCGNCYIGVQFLSQTVGPQSGTLTLSTATGGVATTVIVTADAIPVDGLFLTPVTQDFGTVPVHSSSAAMAFTLANLLSPAGPVSVTSVTATGDFGVAANTTGGASCDGTVATTASCFVEVTFAPTATGLRTGTLSVVTSGGTATSVLTGYGADDPGLALNPDALVFNNVPGASATQQAITVTNTSATTQSLGMLVVSDPNFSVSSTCGTLAPNATCAVAVQFTPQNGIVSATLSIPVTTTEAGQTSTTMQLVSLTGAYTAENAGLEILPGQVNFGPNATGTLGLTRQYTLNNLTSQSLAIGLTLPRQFPLVSGSNTCATLAGGASCNFSVSFLPSTSGPLTGTVFALGTPASGGSVQALTYLLGYGAGTGSLDISGNILPDAPLNFGNITSGQTTQQVLTLTNPGTTTVNIRRITSDPPFYSTSTCTAPLTPQSSCTVTLTYAPVFESSTATAPRSDTGALIVESDAASGPLTLDLAGTVTPVASGTSSGSVIAAFELSQGSLTFEETTVGDASSSQSVSLTNTGTTTVHVFSVLASTDFTAATTCAAILPGDTCTISATFTPTIASTSAIRPGTIEISSDAATSLELISLIGTAAPSPLTISPVALNFGTVNVGSKGQLGVGVTNSTNAAVTFHSVAATGDYSVDVGTCPADGATLAAGASCTLQVIFTPTVAGTRTGTLDIAASATTLPLTVVLTGNAVLAQLQVTPGALAFGSIAVGAPSSLTLTLKNTGTATVTGITTTLSGTNTADFAVTVPCATSSLAPGASCSVMVRFTPSALGPRAATLTIASSDPASPALVALTGTGTQPGDFTLTVGGSSAATMTVSEGAPAVFALTLTPLNGFTGAVALTCTPVVPAQYAGCSLLASTLTLGATPQTSTATITTITSAAHIGEISFAALGLMLGPLVVMGTLRRRSRLTRTAFYMLLAVIDLGVISGCNGSSGNSKVRYTPAGTYEYQVTATSTSGPQVSSTVTLNLIVQ